MLPMSNTRKKKGVNMDCIVKWLEISHISGIVDIDYITDADLFH